ncbi:Mannose-P-dolichol utilization defect 1 protein [Verticillium nonalfalfae]|uniref:Mannose-P-dolichol utilization defect 1 protein homolog n=1 Tax=Verticillium nonalfalfae TaxID=1051616 RepID=A0A3M9Y1I2_9PEZI|nr:Mannose-P-dolichol utilization defect 1 protein [Verticillium nonalfalfae]RNJ54111.1 Mannose-P-dolichol utilization defect 1 protein [Verticillium nonalfalfae]
MDALQETLRPLLQPITHNLPGPINDLALSLLGEQCHTSLVRDITLTDDVCLKLAVSKALGLAIVAAASIVKVPQILKLVSSKSPAGVSVLSYALETAAYVVSLAYNYRNGFPFSTYGETALIAAQNVVITVLVLNYAGRAPLAAIFVSVLAVAFGSLFTDQFVGMEQLSVLQAGAGVVGVASKIPQILAIWQEGGTGQLSAFTVFNYLVGSLTRIFTTLQEVDDKLILYGFIAGFALNAVLATQMVYYWNAPSAKAKGKRKAEPVSYAAAATPSPAGSASATPTKKGPSTRRRG